MASLPLFGKLLTQDEGIRKMTRNLNYDAVRISDAYKRVADSLWAADAIQEVADTFIWNINRIDSFLRLPVHISYISMITTSAISYAHFNAGGPSVHVGKDPETDSRLRKELVELLEQAHTLELLPIPHESSEDVWDTSMHLMNSVINYGGPQVFLGVEALLSGAVLGTWTAFETLAGDLWAKAIDACPIGLAELKGSEKGNKKRTKSPRNMPEESERTAKYKVPLSVMRDLKYDTKGKMGSVLKGLFEFTRLDRIRAAYSVAFWEQSEKIEKILAQQALRKLSIVRNVLVHSNGEIDDDFLQQSEKVSGFNHYKKEDQFIIDGAIVVDLLDPAIKCSTDLIAAVDEWLQNHPMEPRSGESQ